MNSYQPGNVVRVTATAKTAGVLADVDTMVCFYLTPAATAPTSVPAVRDSVGMYHADLGPLETPGQYGYAFKATGAGAAGAEAAFYVSPSKLL